MSARGRELVTADEATVVTESLFDAVVVENGESDRRLPDPAGANESDRVEGACKTNDLLDQPIATKTSPWPGGRQFPERDSIGM